MDSVSEKKNDVNNGKEKMPADPKKDGSVESEDNSECEVDVRSEFKSCIDETISTVCRVASMKKKSQSEAK